MSTARLTSIFLRKFTSLKSLYLELDYSGINHRNVPLVTWKLDSKSGSLTLLLAKGLDLDADDNDAVNEAEAIEDLVFLSAFFDLYMTEPSNWLSLLESLVPLWSKELENVVVTDSKKQGVLVLHQTELVEMRNPNTTEKDGKASMRLWHAPVLQLPLSGRVMKSALLCVLRFRDEVDDDNYLIAEGAFLGADKIYAEAAIEMLKEESAYLGTITI